MRIRPCPSARRITAESQSQRGQAPLRIGSYSSSDESIRHYICSLCFICHLSACLGRTRFVRTTDGKYPRQLAVKAALTQPNAATDLVSTGHSWFPGHNDDVDGPGSPGHSSALVSFSFSNRRLTTLSIKSSVDRLDRFRLPVTNLTKHRLRVMRWLHLQNYVRLGYCTLVRKI